jgi:hypothetical protein
MGLTAGDDLLDLRARMRMNANAGMNVSASVARTESLSPLSFYSQRWPG